MATNISRTTRNSQKSTPPSNRKAPKQRVAPDISPTKPIVTSQSSSQNVNICQICKNDSTLREHLKQCNSSDFINNTTRLCELDADLTDRIRQVSNVNLRIQHLLLNEKEFTEEKTRMLHIESTLSEHRSILDQMSSKFASIDNLCNSVLSEVKLLATGPYDRALDKVPLTPTTSISDCKPKPTPLEINVEPPINIVDNFMTKEECDSLQQHIREENDFTQFTSKFLYYGEHDYSFGKYNLQAKSIPSWLYPTMEKVKKSSSNSERINSCVINVYEDGNSFLRAHADDESMISPWEDILTVSIGAERDMTFSHENTVKSCTLKSGSLLIMTREMQNSWKHSIETVPGLTGCRISLSFRHIDPVFAKSTIVIGDSNTKQLKFGTGKGTFGGGMPGMRIKMNTLLDIPHPNVLLSYANIIIHVGVNDLRNDRVDPRNLIGRLKEICTHLCQRKKSLNIVLSGALPSRNIYLNQQIHEYNYMLYQLSNSMDNVTFLNNNFFSGRNSILLARYASNNINDMVHINGSGTAALAMAMRDKVLSVSKRNRMLYSQVLTN